MRMNLGDTEVEKRMDNSHHTSQNELLKGDQLEEAKNSKHSKVQILIFFIDTKGKFGYDDELSQGKSLPNDLYRV